jgi:hypothetical protein
MPPTNDLQLADIAVHVVRMLELDPWGCVRLLARYGRENPADLLALMQLVDAEVARLHWDEPPTPDIDISIEIKEGG